MSPDEHWDDRVHDAEDLYTEASIRWGGDAQMAKAAEEFAELAAECVRDWNGQSHPDDLLEELVDARIMMEQVAQHITDEALREAVNEGLADLAERVQGGEH